MKIRYLALAGVMTVFAAAAKAAGEAPVVINLDDFNSSRNGMENPNGDPVVPPVVPGAGDVPGGFNPQVPGQDPTAQQLQNAQQAAGIIDQLVNLGDKVFGIVKNNRGVLNTDIKYATALPKDADGPFMLQQWKGPKTKTFRMVSRNVLGVKMMDVTFQVQMNYGGNYQGKGLYLTGVSVQPLAVNVAWNTTVDLSCEVPEKTVVNVGTHEDPLAAMTLLFRWKLTGSNVRTGTIPFFIRGDGYMANIGTNIHGAPANVPLLKSMDKLETLKQTLP